MTEQTEVQEQADEKAFGYNPVLLTQQEAGYIIDATRRQPIGQMCKNCRFFNYPDRCHIVMSTPEPIYPDGWCTWWSAKPAPPEPEPMEVIIMESDEDDTDMGIGMMERVVDESIGGATTKLKRDLDTLWKNIRSALPIHKTPNPYTAFKMLTDDLALAIFTNNFQDRDDEIIEGKALDAMISRMQSGFVPMPELWHAHVPGTRHGQALWVDKAGEHLVYAIIKMDDTPAAKEAARKYQSLPRGSFTLSHGFAYPTWARKSMDIDGEKIAVYHSLNTFEISTLLPGQEANPYTAFATLEELTNMPMTEAKEAQIRALFGKQADTILSEVERMEQSGKALADIGAKYKEFVEVNPTDTETNNKAADEATGSLLADVLSFQGDAAKALQGIEGYTKKEIDGIRAEMKQYAESVNEMKRLMEMPAQPASESAATVVDIPTAGTVDIKALEDALNAAKAAQAIKDKASPAVEFDPFFGDLQVKKR